MEAVYWHNFTPKCNTSLVTVPINMLHHYQVRVKGIDATLPPIYGKRTYAVQSGRPYVGKKTCTPDVP